MRIVGRETAQHRRAGLAHPQAGGADPVTYLLAVSGLAALTLLSAFAPAYGATRIDPLVALREE